LYAELDSALDQLPNLVTDLRRTLVSASDAQLDAARDAIFEQSPIVRALFDDVFEDEVAEVGLRGAAINATDYLTTETAEERSLVQREFDRAISGQETVGDLRPAFRCALYLAKLGAAAVGVLASHGTVLIVAAVVPLSADAVENWKKSSCKECWHEIHRGRL
jgi:hypothetical protein